MKNWQKKRLKWRNSIIERYGTKTTFFSLLLPFTDHVLWLDETAGCGIRAHFGLVERWTNLCAWKLWWNDPGLWKLCLEGIMSPAIFRLLETGKRKCWSGAAAQIRRDNEMVEVAAKRMRDKEG
jgi:dimethylaniline monooxygenase (N-oxide forming)